MNKSVIISLAFHLKIFVNVLGCQMTQLATLAFSGQGPGFQAFCKIPVEYHIENAKSIPLIPKALPV
jgi:hypothetical protein